MIDQRVHEASDKGRRRMRNDEGVWGEANRVLIYHSMRDFARAVQQWSSGDGRRFLQSLIGALLPSFL